MEKLYVVGAGQGVGTASGIVFTAGDYHELIDCESEKCGRSGLLITDAAHPTNGSPREISVKRGNYYLNGKDGIEFEGQGTVGASCRLNRILGANIHDNLGYGIRIDALTSGTLIDGDVHLHGNTLGDVLDAGAATHFESAEALAAHGTRVVEGAYTADQIMRIMAAALAGTSQKTGNTITFKGVDGVTDRIIGSFDAENNRTGAVLNGN